MNHIEKDEPQKEQQRKLQRQWQKICDQADLIQGAGVCALLANNQQIAIFQTEQGETFSLSNWDPKGQANVLYRGIIGDDNGEAYVASPLYKERYLLSCGQCLDDVNLSVRAYDTRILDKAVQVLVEN